VLPISVVALVSNFGNCTTVFSAGTFTARLYRNAAYRTPEEVFAADTTRPRPMRHADEFQMFAVRRHVDRALWPVHPDQPETDAEGGPDVAFSRAADPQLVSGKRRDFQRRGKRPQQQDPSLYQTLLRPRTYKAMEMALYHNLGRLQEPESAHKFC
jgi:hypothetical protein